MKRTLHFWQAGLVGLFLCWFQASAVAQAPNAIAGWTFDFTVTEGTGSYLKSGKFRYCVLNNGVSIRSFKIAGDGVSDSAGSFLYYGRAATNEGRIVFGPGYYLSLRFPTPLSGSYELINTNIFGHQAGLFTAYHGSAPAALTQKTINFSVSSGTAPFVTNGNYRLVTFADGSYLTEKTPGLTFSTGTSAYARVNQSTATNYFQDSLLGDGSFVLTFASLTNGAFLTRTNNSLSAVQIGTFTMSDFVPPTFTTPPFSQTIEVGRTATFSAEVQGTLPLTLQWYKDGGPIAGATNKSYTVFPVELSSAGEYWLEAKNIGAPVPSARARLTPVCGYTLSSERASFGASGGQSVLAVTSTGTCGWSAVSSVDWITLAAPTNGSGLGLITYTVAANPGEWARFGFIHVSGKKLVVTQLGPQAPASLAGKILTLTLTNENGRTLTNLPQKLLAATTNHFSMINQGVTTTGTYFFSRTTTNTAALALTSEAISATLQLHFYTPLGGGYTTTNTNGAPQSGWFQLSQTSTDFNGDAQTPDLLFQNMNGSLAAWFLRGTNFAGAGRLAPPQTPGGGWRAVVASDFNHDGDADVLFQHDTGKLAVWLMRGTNFLGHILLRNGTPAGSGWRVAGTADFNNDGETDILFQHDRRQAAVWQMQETNFLSSMLLRNGAAAPIGWRIVSANDFNADGQADLLWQNEKGRLAAWHLIGGSFVEAVLWSDLPALSAGWRVAGSADANFDGWNDLIWQHPNGKITVWCLNHGQLQKSVSLRQGQGVIGGWNIFGPK